MPVGQGADARALVDHVEVPEIRIDGGRSSIPPRSSRMTVRQHLVKEQLHGCGGLLGTISSSAT